MIFAHAFSFLQERVSRLASFYNFSIEANFVTPLTIRAASCCIYYLVCQSAPFLLRISLVAIFLNDL